MQGKMTWWFRFDPASVFEFKYFGLGVRWCFGWLVAMSPSTLDGCKTDNIGQGPVALLTQSISLQQIRANSHFLTP